MSGAMGDTRFEEPYQLVAQARDRAGAIAGLPDEQLIAALGGASRASDPLMANVLATALQNRVRHLHTVIENLGEGVLLLDVDGRVIEQNPTAFRLLGWPLADLAKGHIHTLVHPACKDARCPILVAFQRPITLQDAEATFVRADRAPIPVAYTITTLQRDEEVEGAVLLVRDMAEHRRAVEATARLASVVGASHDAIFTMTPSGTITSWNPAAERVYGWRSEEIIGQNFSILLPPDAAREAAIITDMVLREGRGMAFETVRRRKDGLLIDVSSSIAPLKDEKTGIVIGMTASSRDISARRRDEQLLRSILEVAPAPILVADEAGRIILANTRAEELFGYGKGELAWREIEDVVPLRLRGIHRLHRASYHANPHARPMGESGMELWGVRKDGSEFPVEISLSPAQARDAASTPLGSVFTVALIREVPRPGAGHARPNADHDQARQGADPGSSAPRDQQRS